DTDVDAGAVLSVAAGDGESGDVGEAAAGRYGTVASREDGSYISVLNNALAAVQALNVGDTLSDEFEYTVTDEHGATSTAMLTITITGTNDGPVAVDDANSIAEDTADVTGNVLTNDTDVD